MNDSGCVNLREEFGDRFRIEYDPAADSSRTLRKDPWYFVMKCKAGELSPQGGTTLRLEIPVTMGSRRRKILERLKGRVQAIEFSDVWAILFEVSDFDLVADLIRPKRRPQLTAQQREQRSEQLKKNRIRINSARLIKRAVL